MLRELDEAARALVAPHVVLFDWHATLVDTLDAMYHAVDDALPRFPELGLMEALIPHEQCKTPEDARLVDYVREHQRLHPKIKAQRRISRTDIFEVLLITTGRRILSREANSTC
jgi:phosphoglycolate phosphatase